MNKRMYRCAFLCFAAAALSVACAGKLPENAHSDECTPLFVEALVRRALQLSSLDASEGSPDSYKKLPAYAASLLADGRLTIGLALGTEDLGRICLPPERGDRSASIRAVVRGRAVTIDACLVLTRAAFRQALADREILFVTSHSRFGAGPVFLLDGKDKPYRMQRTHNYDITMPDSEVSGYDGAVSRVFHDDLRNRDYTVFRPDSTELDASQPLPGYQMLVFSTCTSSRHFLDEIAQFRYPYPTTAVFTSRPCLMDTDMRVFMRLLYEVFSGSPVHDIVTALNGEYRSVAWEHVRKKEPPWEVIENLYEIGIHSVGPPDDHQAQ